MYISYLDSVRYFVSQPEGQRTTVYHSLLIEYLNFAREQGYCHAHIWVSPPKQGDDYIFYAHPEAFHDVTSGCNKGSFFHGFTAIEGWDAATGLGSPNYEALAKIVV